MKKVVSVLFLFLCLSNPFGLFSSSSAQPKPSLPHGPILFYLGVLAEGYPEALLFRELSLARVNVLEIREGMILFGANEQTRITGFLANLPFLKKIYADKKDLINDPLLRTQKIAQQFYRLVNQSNLYLFEKKLRSSGAKEKLLHSFEKDDQKNLKEQESELLIERIRSIDRMLRERGKSLSPRHNIAKPSKGFNTDVAPGTDAFPFGPALWATGSLRHVELGSLSQGISGRVLDSSGAGIFGVSVLVYDLGYNWITESITDADGYYSASDLAAGQYKLFFSGAGYVAEWYNDKTFFDNADPITVVDGEFTNIDAEMNLGGIISGQVTDIQGSGISNVLVWSYDSNGNAISAIPTDANGYYQLYGLPAGNLKIYFDPFSYNAGDYFQEWYDGKNSFSTADDVIVSAGETTIVNAILEQAGAISGRVTSESGIGIQNVQIYVYDENYNMLWWVPCSTDGDGYYTFHSVPSGAFKVYFDASNTGGYCSEFYNDKKSHSLDDADWVYVTAPTTTDNINAELALGGSIFGWTTDITGSGIENVDVIVYDYNYNQVSWGRTDASGYYVAPGIPPGEYFVSFSPLGNYVSEWYDDKYSFQTADQVNVTAGTSVNINAVLAEGGAISGRITGLNEIGPGEIFIYVFDNSGLEISEGYTSDNGEYKVERLPAGNFKIYFSSSWGTYFGEWYNDKTSFETADYVAVKAGQTTSGIDAYLSPLLVTSPTGSTIWLKGDAATVKWVSLGPTASVNIYLYRDFTKVTDIALNTACDGQETWIVPRSLPVGTGYHVLVEDAAHPEANSFSRSFAIRATLALEAPVLLNPIDGAKDQPLSLTLKWQDTNQNPQELNYEVRIKEPGGDYVYHLVPKNGTSYFVSGLKYNTMYFWNVRALGDKLSIKDSSWANEDKDWKFMTSEKSD